MCETGFVDGTLVVPQFVLKELQLVADSGDTLKRNRGRRGLDILHKIQKMAGVEVMVSDVDFPELKEVDLKLIELARHLEGKIVTNDFNLNKVAQLRGVEVLNLNDLANSLKPVVLPGEVMKVFILKEGKEYNQGVAYLDDGTMVVVDNARRLIGKTIDIVVTSVLQTTAGKMIFGRFIDVGITGRPFSRTAPPRRRIGRPRPRRARQARPTEGPRPPSRQRRRRRPPCVRPSAFLRRQNRRPSGPGRQANGAERGRETAKTPPAVGKGGRRLTRVRRPVPGDPMPSFDWWRTVFWLIPTIAVYTIALGTLSIVSSLFERDGRFAHWCARAWSWLILATTGVDVEVRGLERIQAGRDLRLRLESSEHLRHPGALPDLPYQLRIIAKASLGRFPFLGWHLRRTGHLLVDRSSPDPIRILKRWEASVTRGLSLLRLPGRDAQP